MTMGIYTWANGKIIYFTEKVAIYFSMARGMREN